MTELSQALDEISVLNPWSKWKESATIKANFSVVTEDLANLVLSINSEAQQKPENRIATILRDLKDVFDTFTCAFSDFSKNHKLAGGALIAKEALDCLAGPYV